MTRDYHLGNWTEETLAERKANDQCAINYEDYCLVHECVADLGHYLDKQPKEHKGHNPQTGIAYND